VCTHPTQMSHAVKENKCGYLVHDVCLSSMQHEIDKKSTKHVLLSSIWLGILLLCGPRVRHYTL
jgi:hypothetical protein